MEIPKLNLFQGVTGAQPIEQMDDKGVPKEPEEQQEISMKIEVTPDEEGQVDISNMNLDFDDKLKNLKH